MKRSGQTLAAVSFGAICWAVAPAEAGAADLTCFATRSYGISCLAEAGWTQFHRHNTPMRSNAISAISGCPDGRVYAASGRIVSVYHNGAWAEYARLERGLVRKIACAGNSRLWIAHHNAISLLDGNRRQTYLAKEIVPSGKTVSIKDLAVAKDGSVWITLFGGSVAHLKSGRWQVFNESNGLRRRYIVSSIAINANNEPHIGSTRSILRYTGGKWVEIQKPFGSANAMVFDGQGRLWAGLSGKGIYRLDGAAWKHWSAKDTNLASNSIRAMTFDSQGRLWVGTGFGVSVFDGERWTSYQMHNSELADNRIGSIAVTGKGGALAPFVEKETASLSGKVEWDDGQAIARRTIEICAESAALIFRSGTTPCTGRKMHKSTTTGEDGAFSFTELPSANYRMTVQTEEGWKILFLGRRGRLRPGHNMELGSMPLRHKRQ